MEILGAPQLILCISVDRPSAFVVARLCDVFPDGHSTLVSVGVLNLAHRTHDSAAEPVIPGELYEVHFSLNHAARRVLKGHRLRLAISTAWWPMLWPAPEAVTASVLTGRSHLELPLASRESYARAPRFEAPVEAPPSRQQVVTAGLRTRTAASRDLRTGAWTLGNLRENGVFRNDAIDLTYGKGGQDTFSIDEAQHPTARAESRRYAFFERGDWSVRVEVNLVVTSQGGVFDVEARLIGREGQGIAVERAWREKIPYSPPGAE